MHITIEVLYNEIISLKRMIAGKEKTVWVSANEITTMTGRNREWLRRMRNNHPECFKSVKGKQSHLYSLQFFQIFQRYGPYVSVSPVERKPRKRPPIN